LLTWLYAAIESAKLPGGYEIKFRDIAKAGEKVSPGTLESVSAAADTSSGMSTWELVQPIDPNLALAGLRIEIEKSLRRIAAVHSVSTRLPVTYVLRALGAKGALPPATVDGLKTLIRLGNEAVHGARG